MNLVETLRGLLRRWYVVVPGLLLAVVVAVGAWYVVKPGYERTATQLLLPGAQSMPENANPFLFLGGLSNAADVLVRAVGAENVLDEITKEYPKAEVEVTRDGSTPGPVIVITVTGTSDDQAAAVLQTMVAKTGTVLEEIQSSESIAPVNRITVVPVTIDDTSTLQQRNRIIASAGAGLAVAVLAILGASLLDGLALGRRRSGRGTSKAENGEEAVDELDEPAVDDLTEDEATEPESEPTETDPAETEQPDTFGEVETEQPAALGEVETEQPAGLGEVETEQPAALGEVETELEALIERAETEPADTAQVKTTGSRRRR